MPVWHAPPDCPERDVFISEVERLLGQTLEARRDQSLEISAEVEASETRGYVARVRVQSVRGTQERELSHRDCAELTEAVALVTALAIDPQLIVRDDTASASQLGTTRATSSRDQPTSAPPAPSDAPLTVAPATSPAPSTDAASKARGKGPFRFDVAGVGLVGNSALPGVGVGVSARVRVARKHFGLTLQGDYWLPRFQSVADAGTNGAGVYLDAWDVGLKACGAPLLGNLTLSLCVGPTLGQVRGSGNQLLTNPTTDYQRWSAFSAEVNLITATSSFVSTWLGIEVGKSLLTPKFGISEDGRAVQVFAASGWSVSGLAGIGAFR